MALAVDLADRMQRRAGGNPPERLARSGRARADDADGRALAVGAEASEHPGAEADVDRAGDDDLQRLAAALGVEDVEIEAVLLKDAGLLAELGDRAFPAAADRRGDLERFGGKRRRERRIRQPPPARQAIRVCSCVSPFCFRRVRILDPSCPGLTRASIETKRSSRRWIAGSGPAMTTSRPPFMGWPAPRPGAACARPPRADTA